MEKAMVSPKQILDYWYSERLRSHWFSSTPELDAEIVERFESVWESAKQGEFDGWRESPEGCLALAIILDQFPLNMFRGKAKAFSTESMAVEVAKHAIQNQFDKQIGKDKLAFLFMPLMHSELLEEQDLSVKMFSESGLTENLKFAQHHRELVRKYGRFPHRNRILRRDSTGEEIAYLQSPNAFKG
jgi:uncharacterized protein (DUF924 family)